VRSVAAVEQVVPAEQATSRDEYTGEKATFGEHKTVVVFESGTLYELADPIPFGEEYPQSHRCTKLGKFRDASVTDELF